MTKKDEINERAWRDPANWHGGPLGLYASKDDDRAFVPKRSGLGVTVNFSTRTGVGFLIGGLIFAAVIIWVQSSTPKSRAHVTPSGADTTRR